MRRLHRRDVLHPVDHQDHWPGRGIPLVSVCGRLRGA